MGGYSIHVHSIEEMSGARAPSSRPVSQGTAEKAASYIADRDLIELWREQGADSVEIHCLVRYTTFVLEVQESRFLGPKAVKFEGWEALADYMQENDLLFADGNEPCRSFAEFFSTTDVAAVCAWDGCYGDVLALRTVKRPR